MTKHLTYTLLALTLLLAACERPSGNRTPKAQTFTTGYITCYGPCYDSIQAAAVMLDLYSDGLTLDSTGKMQGAGYNLCLTDVFVPDSMLVEGHYTWSNTGDTMTMLPGQNHDGTPHGMYLLTRAESGAYTILVLDSGYMDVQYDTVWHITYTGYYHNAQTYRQKYEATFTGPLMTK